MVSLLCKARVYIYYIRQLQLVPALGLRQRVYNPQKAFFGMSRARMQQSTSASGAEDVNKSFVLGSGLLTDNWLYAFHYPASSTNPSSITPISKTGAIPKESMDSTENTRSV